MLNCKMCKMNKCKMIKNRAALEAFFESGNYSTETFSALGLQVSDGDAKIEKFYNRWDKLCKVTITTTYTNIEDPTIINEAIVNYCVCGIVTASNNGVRVFRGKWMTSATGLTVCGKSSAPEIKGCIKVDFVKNSSIAPLYTQTIYLRENCVYVKKYVEEMTKLLQ